MENNQITIYVKTMIGETYDFKVDPNSKTIGELKKDINAKGSQVQPKKMTLVYENKTLKDSETLSSSDIKKDGAIIMLIVNT